MQWLKYVLYRQFYCTYHESIRALSMRLGPIFYRDVYRPANIQ